MLFAFDLDGTLIRTRDANLAAYRNIGVEPPADFHQVRWETWTDKVTHDAKNMELAKIYRCYAYRLPLMEFASQHPHIILSSVSKAAWALWEQCFKFQNALEIHVNLTLPEKATLLNLQNIPGLYFDDSAKSCQYIQENTRWTAIHVTQY